MRRLALFLTPLSILTASLHASSLQKAQRHASAALEVNQVRTRIAAENVANANSAGYAPKAIYIEQKRHKDGSHTVGVKKITRQEENVRYINDPNHPKADAQGNVAMPGINPLIEMMNMQESKVDSERALKAFEVATSMRHQLIRMMNK